MNVTVSQNQHNNHPLPGNVTYFIVPTEALGDHRVLPQRMLPVDIAPLDYKYRLGFWQYSPPTG